MLIATGRAGQSGAPPSQDLDEAYRVCARIVRSHYENFPVASKFIPRSSRRALEAVYAFARRADDYADERYGPGGPSRAERLAALDDWERRLADACGEARTEQGAHGATNGCGTGSTGGVMHSAAGAQAGAEAGAIFLALGDTIRRHAIPPSLFHDLLSAFRQDVVVEEYANREELLDYCRRSANPVGRIVLAVHGIRGEPYLAWSDAICTGLQLTNFWQDAGVDRAKSRIYLPREDRERFGVGPPDLDAAVSSSALRALVLEEVRWTRGVLEAGKPLLVAAPAQLRLHLRLVWQGGARVLEMIEERNGDVLGRRPKLGSADWVRVFLRAALPVSLR